MVPDKPEKKSMKARISSDEEGNWPKSYDSKQTPVASKIPQA
jgi:hypothetical protein